MRLKDLQLDSQGVLNIDIMELPASCVIVLSEGRAKFAELPPHADTTIKTFKGKVTRVNFDEGVEF